MNRRHTVDDYRRVIDALRRAAPGIALSSDFIVGHPGETDADFKATLSLVREVGYAQAYSFKYSPRPGTPAADDDDQIPEEVKAERLARLQQVLSDRQLSFNRRSVGAVVPVLLDRHGKRPHQLAGRTPHMQAVHVDCGVDGACALFGAIMPVLIEAAHANSLTGRPISAATFVSPAAREPASA
jgi:tRNA-2-methylthio-N6-dimethylallyladenosine synthase